MKYQNPNQCYNDFWKEIVENEDGSINLDQVKKELFDFSKVINNVQFVYDRITDGATTNPLVLPETIIVLFEDYVNEAVKDEIEDLIECGDLIRIENSAQID